MGFDFQRSCLNTTHPDAARPGQWFQPVKGQLQDQGHQGSPYNTRAEQLDPFEMMASFRKVISWLKNNDFRGHDEDDLSTTYSESDDYDDDDDGDDDDLKDEVREVEVRPVVLMTKRKSLDTDFLLEGFDATGSSLKRRKSAVEAQPEIEDAEQSQKLTSIKAEHHFDNIIIISPR